jgi:hypothetical protein
MPVTSDPLAELYTVIENTSGQTRTFSPIGKRLAAGEIIALRGDVVANLGNQRDPRNFEAYRRSLVRNSLLVHSRPSPVLWDATRQQPYSLAVHNGVLGIVDPTYASTSSEHFDAV